MKLSRQRRKLFILGIILLVSGLYARYPGMFPSKDRSVAPRQSTISTACRARRSSVQVSGEGIV
ncbi:MAG TPA: hypothetical protein ENK84_07055, partial [Desulfobulbus sp.]|nr:hypothetical protein [Desulfobulbus sp.]